MKNQKWCWVLIALAVIALPACLGPGNLGGQLGKWNVTEFENKWAQEGMFLVLLPAYVVCAVGDLLIFNSIQWWWGINPIESPAGSYQVL